MVLLLYLNNYVRTINVSLMRNYRIEFVDVFVSIFVCGIAVRA